MSAASTGIGGVGMSGVQTLATDEQELRAAQDKLEESKRLAETAMFNVVNNEARAHSSEAPIASAQPELCCCILQSTVLWLICNSFGETWTAQPEQIAQLCALVQAECEYHAASHAVLARLLESLKSK